MTHRHAEATQLVKAPREKVFQVVADWENWPKWSTLYTSFKATKREGNTEYVKYGGRFLGREFEETAKATLIPPDRIEGEEEEDSKLVFTFDSVPEGTRVTLIRDAETKGVKGVLLRILLPLLWRATFKRELPALAKYVEATK